ncbi:hypothetical protein JCM10207_007829 [Rhodosporidiobolus poonsookiae]
MATTKGKGRAQDAFDRSDDLERAPLLAPASDNGSAASSPAKPTRLRHGRGPLVRDDTDDDEPLPPNVSEDDTSRYVVVVPADSHRRRGLTWGGAVCLFLGLLFCLVLVTFAVVHLWVGHLLSEQAKHGTPEEMAQRGLLWTGPSAVRVSALAGEGNGGLAIELDGMAGVDVRRALDWEAKDKGGWFRRQEGRIARWGVRKARSVSVNVGEIAIYDATASSFDIDADAQEPLIVVPALDTLRLPLSYPTKADPLPAMQPFTLHVPVTFPSPADLSRFGHAVWENKTYRVRAAVRQVNVKVGEAETGGVAGWFMRRMGGVRVSGIERVQAGELPDLPGTSDPMSMVSNLTYSAFESPSPAHPNTTVIAFSAGALLKNPLDDAIQAGRIPPFAWGMPFRVPITVSLPLPPAPEAKKHHDDEPEDILLAKVASAPFFYPLNAHTANLSIAGHVVPAGNLTPSTPTPPSPPVSFPPSYSDDSLSPLKKDDQAPLSRALSTFVARYLSGRPNTVSIRYDPTPEPPLPSEPSSDAPFPPPFLASLLSNEVLRVDVPGTNETPDFFQNLRMEDMRIKLGGMGDGDDADLLASGRVVGEVALPPAAEGLADGIDAKWIWPDVLVYDGDLPGRSVMGSWRDTLVRLAGLEVKEESAASAAQGQLAFSSAPSPALAEPGPNDSSSYPPSPVPANAFARMRPSSSMLANTTHLPGNSTHPGKTLVSATFVDAPLYLLPGRGDVLRRFVAKIVFGPPGEKVKASMAGETSVRVGLDGFGEVELVQVPIEASFMVGRGGVENPPPARFA